LELRNLPRGHLPIRTIPGLGSIAERTLTEKQVISLVDLARLDPYDERFMKLGEGFPRWVLHARNLLADEVIKSLSVTSESIRVTLSKLYDREVSVKSVLARLGVYYVYVDVDVREGAGTLEIVMRLKPEQVPFAQGQWMEYRANAEQLRTKLQSNPQTHPTEAATYKSQGRWRNMNDFQAEAMQACGERSDMVFLLKVYLRLLLAESANLLVIWDENSMSRTSARIMLESFTPILSHIVLGGSGWSTLLQQVRPTEWSVVIIDDYERATPLERKFVLELLSSRIVREKPEGVEKTKVECSVMMNVWRNEEAGSRLLDPDLLSQFDLALKMPRARERVPKVDFFDGISREDSVSLSHLIQTLRHNRPIQKAPQQKYLARYQSYRPPAYLAGFGAQLPSCLEKLALAEARFGFRSEVGAEDYTEANRILQSALSSLSYRTG
jgi:hypothetical protein